VRIGLNGQPHQYQPAILAHVKIAIIRSASLGTDAKEGIETGTDLSEELQSLPVRCSQVNCGRLRRCVPIAVIHTNAQESCQTWVRSTAQLSGRVFLGQRLSVRHLPQRFNRVSGGPRILKQQDEPLLGRRRSLTLDQAPVG